MRCWLIAIAGLLAGCTLGDAVLSPPGDAGPSPPYRKVVAGGLAGIVGEPKNAGPFQISGLRQVDSLRGPAWLVCLKATDAKAGPLLYAVFIRDDKIVDSRLAIRADQCDAQAYSRFNPAKP